MSKKLNRFCNSSFLFYPCLFVIFIFYFALGASVCLQAEESPTLPSAEPGGETQGTPINRQHELVYLEMEMAESSYELHKTVENRSNLITAYEKMVHYHCMRELMTTLVYSGPPENNPECEKFIEKLLMIDPENPTAVCAKDGIDSESCSKSYSLQEVLSFDQQSSRSPVDTHVDIEASLSDESVLGKIQEKQKKFSDLKKRYDKTKDEAALTDLKSIMQELLTLGCKVIRIHIEAFQQPGAPKTPTPVPEKLQGIFDRDPTPSSDLDSIQYKRVRYLSSKCLHFIRRALETDPGFSRAICIRDGSYSPTCVKARRSERAKVRSKSADPSKSASSLPRSDKGFEEF